jgi:DNA-directed RNA polymerase subunit RPC12/RpoP
LCREFLGKAKQAFDALFDDGQQEQLITLTQREARILQQGAELHSWLLEKHLAQDPTANPAEVEAIRCPNCHRVGVPAKQKKDAVPRRVKTRAGEQEFTRRKYRCAHCRRRFFPLGR